MREPRTPVVSFFAENHFSKERVFGIGFTNNGFEDVVSGVNGFVQEEAMSDAHLPNFCASALGVRKKAERPALGKTDTTHRSLRTNCCETLPNPPLLVSTGACV